MGDEERERDRLEMKSGAKDPMTAPGPQQVRAHPTEGEKLQWGGDLPKRADPDKHPAVNDDRPIAEQ